MSTNSNDIAKFMQDKVDNKGNNTEELVFDRETMKLVKKKKEHVTSADRKVHLKMVEFFNIVVKENYY